MIQLYPPDSIDFVSIILLRAGTVVVSFQVFVAIENVLEKPIVVVVVKLNLHLNMKSRILDDNP